MLTAGTELGWRRMRDLDETDEDRIGYAMATIRDGRRCNAAGAILHPVRSCPNLTVALHTLVDRVLLEGDRATGVRGRRNGQGVEALAAAAAIIDLDSHSRALMRACLIQTAFINTGIARTPGGLRIAA